MHDEFERAVTGERPRRGLSPLGWLLTTIGLFTVVGIFAAGWAATRVLGKARAMAAELVSELRPGELAAAMVTNLRGQEALLELTPDDGVRWLGELRGGDPVDAMLERVVAAPFRSLGDQAERARRQERAGRSGSERSLTLHSDDGDVRFDLRRDDGGAALVIDGQEGRVRLDLGRTRDGGFLTIDSDDGHARVDLARTARGGRLTIDSDRGTVRIDATGGDDGARLEIQTEDGESLRLAIGDAAEAMPAWVPRLDGMPTAPRGVYSLQGREGSVGGVTWTADAGAEDVLEEARALLQEEGYDLRAEHEGREGGRSEGSLWARDEAAGHFVFVVARETSEGTRVLLGHGQRD